MGTGQRVFYLSADIPANTYVEMVALPRNLLRVEFNFRGGYTPEPTAIIRLMRGDIIEQIRTLAPSNWVSWPTPTPNAERSLQVSRVTGREVFWGDIEIRWEWQESPSEPPVPVKPALPVTLAPQEKICPKCRETWVEL